MLLPKLPSPGRVYIPYPHAPRIKAKFRVRITNRGHRITNYMRKWENTFLRRSGAAIRAYVIRGFKVVANKNIHSKALAAPYLHKPKSEFIRVAIRWHVDYTAREVLVGPLYSIAKLWGWKHEHGKKYGRAQYPMRPFMAPQFRRWWKIGRRTIIRDIRHKM